MILYDPMLCDCPVICPPGAHREVVYHGIYSPKDLKSAVKQHLYPLAINCVVIYNSPPDCSRGTRMNKTIIKGTKMAEIPFPFKVYEVKSK